MNRIHITRSAVALLLLLAWGSLMQVMAAPQQKHPLPEWLRCPRFFTEASDRDEAKAHKPGEITALVRNVAESNGSAFCLSVYRNGEAFFQSRVAPRAPEMGQIDCLQEALAEGNRLGVKIIASIDLNAISHNHPLYPECAARGVNGKAWDLSASGLKGTGYPCLNNPEYRRYLLSLVEEIFTRYAPDGLSIEGLSPHLCYCPVCRERYRAQFKKEMPVQFAHLGPQCMLQDSSSAGDPDSARLTRFLDDTEADLARAIIQAVKRSRPNAVALYHASPKQDTPSNYDGTLGEIAQDKPSLQSLWDIGELADYDAASPIPLLYPIPPRCRTDAEARAIMWQALANRAYPNVVSLQGAAQVFAYLKENAGYYDFEHVQPVRFLAFPRSFSNDMVQQRLAPHADGPQENATAPFLDSYRGMYSALQQARLPIVTLHRDQLSEGLKGFRVLALANEAALSDKQIQGIVRFVREGGGLIATHETSLYDEQGRRRANFGLAALFGADYLSTLPGPSLPRNAAAHSDRALCFAPALGIRKPQPTAEAHVLVRATDACVVGTLRGMGIPKGAPAILLHAFGKGRVAYLPGRQDALFSRQANPTTPALLERLVRWVSQDSVPVKVSGSGRIAVTLTDVPGHRLVHLVNQNTGSKTAHARITPLKGITVSLAFPAGKRVIGAYALRSRKVLEVTFNGDRAVVHLPLLGEYEAVRFDLQ